jgi:hypothetical protein
MIRWFMQLLPVAIVIGGTLAGKRLDLWVVVFSGISVFVILFAFLEELNKNVCSVRDQMKAFRDDVSRVNEHAAQYRDPESNFSLYDALKKLDREWENSR